MAHRNINGIDIYYMTLHRKVMVAYVLGENEDWKAYIFPVPGYNHDHEVVLWESEGCALSESQARSLWPGLVKEFDDTGLNWRN